MSRALFVGTRVAPGCCQLVSAGLDELTSVPNLRELPLDDRGPHGWPVIVVSEGDHLIVIFLIRSPASSSPSEAPFTG